MTFDRCLFGSQQQNAITMQITMQSMYVGVDISERFGVKHEVYQQVRDIGWEIGTI